MVLQLVFLEAFHILMLIKEWYWNTVYFQYSAKLGLTELEAWHFTSAAVSAINWKQPQQFLSVTPFWNYDIYVIHPPKLRFAFLTDPKFRGGWANNLST
jgi:hypothetical protein